MKTQKKKREFWKKRKNVIDHDLNTKFEHDKHKILAKQTNVFAFFLFIKYL